MAVSSQWAARQWARSQECHGLCRLLAALRAQRAPEGLVEVLAREVSLLLKPRKPTLFVYVDYDRSRACCSLKYIDADTLGVIREQGFSTSAVDVVWALEATSGGGHLAMSCRSRGTQSIVAFGVDSTSELGRRQRDYFSGDSLAFAPDEQHLVAAVVSGNLQLLGARSLALVREARLDGFRAGNDEFHSVKYTAGGDRVVASSEKGAVWVLDGLIMSVLQTARLGVAIVSPPGTLAQFRDASGREHVAFQLRGGVIRCLEVETFAVSQEAQVEALRCFAFTPRGLAVVCGGGDLRLLEFPSLRLMAAGRVGSDVVAGDSWLHYVESRKTLVLACESAGLYLIDGETLGVLTHTATPLLIYVVAFPAETGPVVQRRAVEDSPEAAGSVIESVAHADAAARIDGDVAMLESDLAWVEHVEAHIHSAPEEGAGEVATLENEPAWASGEEAAAAPGQGPATAAVYLLRYGSAPRGGSSVEDFFQAVLGSPQLAACLRGMALAGLEPRLPGGALLLVAPQQHDGVRRALVGREVRRFNAVVSEHLEHLLEEVRNQLPFQRRPKVKRDEAGRQLLVAGADAAGSDEAAEELAGLDEAAASGGDAEAVEWALRVERTFLCYAPLRSPRNAGSVAQSTTEAVGPSEAHYGHYRGGNPRRRA